MVTFNISNYGYFDMYTRTPFFCVINFFLYMSNHPDFVYLYLGEDQLPDMIPTPDSSEISEFQALSPEDQEKQKLEWTQELAKVNSEM